jgi:TRAP-type C4-dicarboxylate transport system substrate-binding protein
MSRRALAFALAAASLLTAAAPARAEKIRLRWLLAHPTLESFVEAADAFKKKVEGGRGGAVEVELVTAPKPPAGPPPGEASTVERVARGEAELGQSFTEDLQAAEPALAVFTAPWLFRGDRHYEGVFDGPAGAELLAGLGVPGIEGLAFGYSGGARALLSPREIRRPADLAGLKVGVYGKEDGAWLAALGAAPVAVGRVPFEAKDLARRRALDAVLLSWRDAVEYHVDQEFLTASLDGVSRRVTVTYANRRFLEGLPPGLKTLITEAARDAERLERAKMLDLNATARRGALALGLRAVPLGDEERAAFERSAGDGLSRRIRETADGPAPRLERVGGVEARLRRAVEGSLLPPGPGDELAALRAKIVASRDTPSEAAGFARRAEALADGAPAWCRTDALRRVARLWLEIHDAGAAARALKKALALDPFDLYAVEALARLPKIHSDENSISPAMPDSYPLEILRARLSSATKRGKAAAVEKFENAIANAPDWQQAPAYRLAAQAWLELGRPDAARESALLSRALDSRSLAFETLFARIPHPRRGVTSGRPEPSRDSAELEDGPVVAYIALADAYLELGDRDQARDCLFAALTAAPKNQRIIEKMRANNIGDP